MVKPFISYVILYLIPTVFMATFGLVQLVLTNTGLFSSAWPFLPTHTMSTNSDNNRNKTLVILLGNLRGGEIPWKTLEQNLLDPNQADLALLIGQTRPEFQNSSLFQRAKYVWNVPEYTDWADAIDLVQGNQDWRKELLPLVYEKSWVLGGIQGHEYVGSGSIMMMMRWFLSERLQNEGVLEKYKHFVITRSDHYYVCQDLSLVNNSDFDDNVLYVPKGEDYGGITDRHLIVSRKNILQALDILPPILKNPRRYAHLFDATHGNNLERLIAYRWYEEGLPVVRYDRVMFIAAQEGDTTRTKRLGAQTPEGIRLKYPMEYVASYMTCGKQPGVIS